MKLTVLGAILVLSTIDGAFFVQAAFAPHWLTIALIVHLLLCWATNWLIRYLDATKKVPSYWFLFLPGLGGVLVVSLYYCLLYFKGKSMSLEDYEHYIHYQRFYEDEASMDYEKEIRILSFMDQMQLLDVQAKKQLIAETEITTSGEQVRILKQGLADRDGEVQHYSAVTLNMLENDYTRLINELREEYNLEKSPDTLKQLARAYEGYIISGLLTGSMLEVFNQEYIEVLRLLTTRKNTKTEELHQLVQAYLRAGDLVSAGIANQRLITLFPNHPKGVLNQMQIAYVSKNYKEVAEILRQAPARQVELVSVIHEQAEFWLAKEENL